MRMRVSDESVEVLLSPWQKLLGLLGNITVPRSALGDVHVVENPMREVMRAGLKIGLRIPWLYFVARTIRLDEAFIVRRGVPALSFSVEDGRTLQRVLVSTPRAQELAQELRGA